MPSTEQEWINEIKGFIENYKSRVLELGTVFMFMYVQNLKTTTILNIDIEFQIWGWLGIICVF